MAPHTLKYAQKALVISGLEISFLPPRKSANSFETWIGFWKPLALLGAPSSAVFFARFAGLEADSDLRLRGVAAFAAA